MTLFRILFEIASVIVLSVALALLCCYFVEWGAEATYNIIHRNKNKGK
jgi:hypothetical protein